MQHEYIMVCPENDKIQKSSERMADRKDMKVRNFPASFKIGVGKAVFGNTEPLNDWFVLEIEYEDSKNEHASTLPSNGWDSQLRLEYANTTHDLADSFLQENDLILINHLNSWPKYRAIVRTDFKKRAEKTASQGRNNLRRILKKNKSFKRPRILHGIYKQIVTSNRGNISSGEFSTLPNDGMYNKKAFNEFATYLANEMEAYTHLRNHATKLRRMMYRN